MSCELGLDRGAAKELHGCINMAMGNTKAVGLQGEMRKALPLVWLNI